MGDKEFENYLNGGEGEEFPYNECQKRLMFDMVKQKLDSSTDLIGIYSELHIKFPEAGYEAELKELRKISKNSFEQLDYLMSVILEELNDEGPENE